MPTHAKLRFHRRYTVSGATTSGQGADGTGTIASLAFRAMRGAQWVPDQSAPSFPVHEYDRTRPAGDAYKAVWGYNAETRTQNACCGAVCYTFRIPEDALGRQDGCVVTSFTATVAGDRYLDLGAILVVAMSDSETPPAFGDVYGWFASSNRASNGWLCTESPVCGTAEQTDASGQPLAQNKRAGVTADFAMSAPQGGSAPMAFAHAILFLADYDGVRGAWIEGGALLAGPELGATFSASVEPDADPAVPLAVGLVAKWTANRPTMFTDEQRIQLLSHGYPASVSVTFAIDMLRLGKQPFLNAVDMDTDIAAAMLLAPYIAYDALPDNIQHGVSASMEGGPKVAMSRRGAMVSATTFIGITGSNTFTSLRLPMFACYLDCLLVAYGFASAPCLDVVTEAAEQDDERGPMSRTLQGVVPAMRGAFNGAVRSGKALAIPCYTHFLRDYETGSISTIDRIVGIRDDETVDIPAKYLGSAEVRGILDGAGSGGCEIVFPEPFETGETAGVCVFAYPKSSGSTAISPGDFQGRVYCEVELESMTHTESGCNLELGEYQSQENIAGVRHNHGLHVSVVSDGAAVGTVSLTATLRRRRWFMHGGQRYSIVDTVTAEKVLSFEFDTDNDSPPLNLHQAENRDCRRFGDVVLSAYSAFLGETMQYDYGNDSTPVRHYHRATEEVYDVDFSAPDSNEGGANTQFTADDGTVVDVDYRADGGTLFSVRFTTRRLVGDPLNWQNVVGDPDVDAESASGAPGDIGLAVGAIPVPEGLPVFFGVPELA